MNIFWTVLLEKLIFLGKQVFITHFINFGTAKNPVGLKLESKNSKNPADKYFLQNNKDGKCSHIGKHSVAAIWNKTFLDKLLSIELTKSFWEFLMLHIKKCLGHSPQRLLFQYYIKGWIWFWYGAPSSMHIFQASFCVYFLLFFVEKILFGLINCGSFFRLRTFSGYDSSELKGSMEALKIPAQKLLRPCWWEDKNRFLFLQKKPRGGIKNEFYHIEHLQIGFPPWYGQHVSKNCFLVISYKD